MRSPTGASSALLAGARHSALTMLASVALALEYEAICRLADHRLAAGLNLEEVDLFVDAVLAMVEPVEIHFLWRPLFAEARRLVRPGGVIVSAIHTVRSTMNPKYTVAIGELRSYFADWEILVDREDEIAEIVTRKT